MPRFNLHRFAVVGVVVGSLLAGLIGASSCMYTVGTSCGPNCCRRDSDCSGGKVCNHGECQCPPSMIDCGAGTCVAPPCPTCTDSVQNGAETDVDCGGPACSACIAGRACLASADCQSALCQGNVCQDTSATGCGIDSASYAKDAMNPLNACESCQPALSTSAWTPLPDGTTCGAAQICSAGSCQSGCWIGSAFYGNASSILGNNCQSCQPGVLLWGWSKLPDGTSCGAGMVCDFGICENGCWIGLQYFGSDAPYGSNKCQSCQPAKSTSGWMDVANGSVCDSGICYTGACMSGCWINTAYVTDGMVNPDNPCKLCDPTVPTMWSNVPDAPPTNCGGGLTCSSGLCGSGCTIGSTHYYSGDPDPTNTCQSCQPGTSTTAWTDSADGSSCVISGSNEGICHAGTCKAECLIGSTTFYANGALESGFPCQSCQPGISTSGWTPVTNGTSCGAGQVCNNGTCSTGCWIGTSFYNSGLANPANPGCQSCQPAISTSTWTAVDVNHMAVINGGTFTMGSPTSEVGRDPDETQHTVILTHKFEISRTEVTQTEFMCMMNSWNPSQFSGCPTCPVEKVGWGDAAAYVNQLSLSVGAPACYVFSGVTCRNGNNVGTNYMSCMNATQKGIKSATVTNAVTSIYDCTGFRLPTEAEWEYSARAGTTTATYNGDLDAGGDY